MAGHRESRSRMAKENGIDKSVSRLHECLGVGIFGVFLQSRRIQLIIGWGISTRTRSLGSADGHLNRAFYSGECEHGWLSVNKMNRLRILVLQKAQYCC